VSWFLSLRVQRVGEGCIYSRKSILFSMKFKSRQLFIPFATLYDVGPEEIIFVFPAQSLKPSYYFAREGGMVTAKTMYTLQLFVMVR
jgi:hypothetical protein